MSFSPDHPSRNTMFNSLSFVLCATLSVCAVANRAYPPKKVIRLSLGVSKAAYLPVGSGEYVKDGYIMDKNNQRTCKIDDWTAKSYERKETEIFMFKHEQQKLVVFGFRGTEPPNLHDWKQNFNIVPHKSTIGGTTFETHKGFRERYGYIAPWFENKYKKVPQDYTIVLTGHSLGAAEAAIAAVFAAGKLKRAPDAVVTFSSPLIGKESFARYYKQVVGCDRTLIITAKFDPIASLPFRYYHPCPKTEVNGVEFLPNPFHEHDLYKGVEIGIKRKYNKNKIGYGCDVTLE